MSRFVDTDQSRLPSVLICGYERGGTTLLSDILRSNGYESGFECGVLLAESPSQFRQVKPYYDMLLSGWKISAAVRTRAVATDFAGFYSTIIEESFSESDATSFFDKTPIYMSELGKCLYRTDFIERAIVIHRDPRSVFVSMAKRLSPKLPVSRAITENFERLVSRYLRYFIGSISHIDSAQVLFISFEDLSSREDATLKSIGLFLRGEPFYRKAVSSRFPNVTARHVDTCKVSEYEALIPEKLQREILRRTRLASPFFMNVSERIAYGKAWNEKLREVRRILSRFELAPVGVQACGVYFEPMTYLLRYPDVLAAGVDPMRHFRDHGQKERRNPA